MLLPVTLIQRTGVIGAVIAVIGLLSAYTSLRFDVSVASLATLDPAVATETRFLVSNLSPFTIHNVYYACKYAPPQTGGLFVAYGSLVPFPIANLRSHGEFSAFCHAPMGLASPVAPGTLLDVEVSYTPTLAFWKDLRGGELFVLKYDKANNAVWLPVGDMTPGARDLKKIACPACD